MSDKSNSLKQPQGSLGKTIRNYKLELGMTVILIVLYIVLHAVTGTALGKGNVMNVLQSAAPLLIMTMGQLLVVITGGIDLCNAGRRSFFDQGHLGRQLSDDHPHGVQGI